MKDQLIQELLASQLSLPEVKPELADLGWETLMAWDKTAQRYACVDAIVSNALDSKARFYEQALTWLDKAPQEAWGLIAMSLLMRSMRSDYFERMACQYWQRHREQIPQAFGNVRHQIAQRGKKFLMHEIVKELGISGFRYYPPGTRQDLYDACAWVTQRPDPKDLTEIARQLSTLSKLDRMPDVQWAIVAALGVKEVSLEILQNTFASLATKAVEVVCRLDSLYKGYTLLQDEAIRRFEMTKVIVMHLPSLTPDVQRELLAKLVKVGAPWLWYHSATILQLASQLFPQNDPFWEEAATWLATWSHFRYEHSECCHFTIKNERCLNYISFSKKHDTERFINALMSCPPSARVRAIALCYKKAGREQKDRALPKVGGTNWLTMMLKADIEATKEHFRPLVHLESVGYESMRVCQQVTGDRTTVIDWCASTHRGNITDLELELAQIYLESNIPLGNFLTAGHARALISAGYNLEQEDLVRESLWRIVGGYEHFSYSLPWSDESFGQWKQMILSCDHSHSLILEAIGVWAERTKDLPDLQASEKFALIVRPLLGQECYLENLHHLAWSEGLVRSSGEVGRQTMLHSPKFARALLVAEAHNPKVVNTDQRGVARTYYLEELENCRLACIPEARRFLSEGEIEKSIVTSNRVMSGGSVFCVGLFTSEDSRKRLVGWLTHEFKVNEAKTLLEWVKAFDLATEGRIIAELRKIAKAPWREDNRLDKEALALLPKVG